MTVYSATFIRRPTHQSEFFVNTCRVAEGILTDWRKEVPARRKLDYVVCEFEGSPWIRIDGTLQREHEQALSSRLETDVLGIYAIDEHRLQFSLGIFRHGQVVRDLQQSHDRIWTTVAGTEQDWESVVFFDDRELALYEKFAKDENNRANRQQMFAARRIVEGADVPWGADGWTLERLAKNVGLPWLQCAETCSHKYLIRPLEERRSSWMQRFLSTMRKLGGR